MELECHRRNEYKKREHPGMRAFGVEPDRIGPNSGLTSLKIASKRMDQGVFATAVGERLPFRDDTFDLVVMDQVIEHVADQKRVLDEALRILNLAGRSISRVRTIFGFTSLTTRFGSSRCCQSSWVTHNLRLRGRDPILLQQINYTTNWRVRRLLRSGGAAAIADMNREAFLARCKGSGGISRSRKARFRQRLAASRMLGERCFGPRRFMSDCGKAAAKCWSASKPQTHSKSRVYWVCSEPKSGNSRGIIEDKLGGRKYS